MNQRTIAGFSWTIICCAITSLAAQEPHSAAEHVVAYVHGTPILQGQVDRLLGERWADDRPPSVEARQMALQVVIDQRVAGLELQRLLGGKTEKQIAEAVQAWKDRLDQRGESETAFYARTGLSEAVVQLEIAWQVNWALYLETYLTEEAMQKFFDKHRRDFDGTRVKVSQIQWLLKASLNDESTLRSTLLERAYQLRERIEAGEIEFSDAAREFSEAPSAEQGGELGWISRDGPMDESFTSAAFVLNPGDISPPTVSPFGVHLILCEELQPGSRTFDEVRDAVNAATRKFLFQRLATPSRGAVRMVQD